MTGQKGDLGFWRGQAEESIKGDPLTSGGDPEGRRGLGSARGVGSSPCRAAVAAAAL